MLILFIYIALNVAVGVKSYSNILYNLVNVKVNLSRSCGGFSNSEPVIKLKLADEDDDVESKNEILEKKSLSAMSIEAPPEGDPMNIFQRTLNGILFGKKYYYRGEDDQKVEKDNKTNVDTLALFAAGNVMRAEVYKNRSGVHLPITQWLHRGHCYLNASSGDAMQTAVNAFSIFLDGNLDDVMRLPSKYVLKSARTISMMNIAREKLVATWYIVKDGLRPDEVTFQMLEYYRPLFKYTSGKEMAKLNLNDERILSYIGTHADLDRHQVGVVASKYITINPNWRLPRYLNLMNNLLCGVPMKFMRRVQENVYLQLSHQLFYHIRACDPLQRRFYLAMMTRTQVLGKSNSWSARDVARLGLLLTEVDGPDLSAISPEAMVGITTQVMMEMSAANLLCLTQTQLQYLSPKPLNILTKKVNLYKDDLLILSAGMKPTISLFILFLTLIKGLKI